MRKNLTEIVFILDRSGSMNGLERDTIGGFNSMIEQQKKAEGEALISTVLFDNVSEVLHDRVNVRDIRPMTDRDYTVRGCTALLVVLLLAALLTGVIKLDQVEGAADFLIEIMPVMFIPAAVGLLNAWDVLRPVVVPVVVVTVVTTVLVMGVTGQVTQRVIRWERKRKEGKEK